MTGHLFTLTVSNYLHGVLEGYKEANRKLCRPAKTLQRTAHFALPDGSTVELNRLELKVHVDQLRQRSTHTINVVKKKTGLEQPGGVETMPMLTC